MTVSATSPLTSPRRRAKGSPGSRRLADMLTIAEQHGLLSGGRTVTVRGRMPSQLVEQAKKKTGIQSASKLLEAALASLVTSDDYGEWLLSQSGTIPQDVELEF